jgi:hypothetical protein
MFNVNELTSRLAKMSDPQLQQYAKIHKDDPYTLALAAAESKRRSQLRAGGQQQAAQQPTVADQALAQMGAPAPMPQPQLPEQQGIGMLPAENVATMADGGIAGYGDSYADEYAAGGIVAFDNGGRVPSFNLSGGNQTVYGKNTTDVFNPPYVEGTSSPIGRFVGSNVQAGVEGVQAGVERARDLTAYPQGSKEAYAAQQKRLEQERALVNKLQQLEGFGFKQQTKAQQEEAAQVRKELAALRSSRPVAPVAEAPAPAPGTKATNPNYVEPPDEAPPAPPRRKTGTGTRTGPGAGTTTKDGKAGTTTASDFVPNKTTTLNAELERLEQFNPGVGQYDLLKNKLEEGYAKLQKERDESKPKGKPYEGLEALLSKEEDKAKGKEKQNLYMAMLNAGLATMGGKSQYAMQNIAEGAQVGTKQYQEGLEKLEAAAIERRKQAALIEEARRAEARGDWKEEQQLKQQAFEAGLTAERSKIDATMNIWGVNQKTAVELTTAQNRMAADDARAQMQQREETQRAREQNISAERIADKYANSRLGGAGLRGQITDDDIYKAYNRNMEKDTFGDFKKDFPDFASYRNYVLQQMKQGSAPADATGGIKFLGFEK